MAAARSPTIFITNSLTRPSSSAGAVRGVSIVALISRPPCGAEGPRERGESAPASLERPLEGALEVGGRRGDGGFRRSRDLPGALPAVDARGGEQGRVQGRPLARGQVLLDVAGRAHAGDGGGDG